MVTYEYDLDVVPRGVPVVVPVKQYEDDAEIVLHAYSRRATLVVPTGSTAFIRGTKPDGNVYSANIELENFGENTVDAVVDVTKQMTAVQGRALFEVVFTYQQAEIITASFVLDVVDAAMDLDSIQSESILRELQDKVDNAYVEDGYLYLTCDGQVIAGPFQMSGTFDHSALENRDEEDQHPMSAITGLEDALAEKQPTGDYAYTDDLDAIAEVIPSSASSANKLVSASEMGDAIASVEAKQLYATASQGSFATKASLTGASTYYNADGTVATLTKNDVAYVLADESHGGKSAKYVIASVDPVVWGFVITFSDTTFTQAQMDAINSGITSAKRNGYDTHVSDGDIHVTAAQKTTWSGKQDALPTAVNDRYLHTNASTGALEWKAMPQELAVYDLGNIPNTSEIYNDLQNGKLPIFVYNSAVPERGIYICSGGEYENDVLTYYFLRLVGNTVRYFKQSNPTAHQWSGQGSYDLQTAISDLATIRSGAAAGETAVQPSALNDYYTATETDAAIAAAIGDAIGGEY